MPQYNLKSKRGLANPPYPNKASDLPRGIRVRFHDPHDKAYHGRTGVSQGRASLEENDISVKWDSDNRFDAIAPELLLIEDAIDIAEFKAIYTAEDGLDEE